MDRNDDVVILSATRTPIGSFGGVFKDVSAVELGAIAIREAIARAGIQPHDAGDVVMGCVLQAGAGMNVARQCALKAGLPIEVPAETVNRVCGSGLQAVVHAVEGIRVGYVDTVIAGGTESMSNAPYLLKGARWGYRMGNAEAIDSMLAEGLTCAIGLTHMGITAEEVATRLRRVTCRSGRVRCRESGCALSPPSPRAASGTRSWRSRFRSAKASRSIVDKRRVPAARHHGREARSA